MRPTKPTTPAERKVIFWLFTTLGVAGVAYIGFSWWTKASECQESCLTAGASEGHLRLNGGSRLNIGSHCECSRDGALQRAE